MQWGKIKQGMGREAGVRATAVRGWEGLPNTYGRMVRKGHPESVTLEQRIDRSQGASKVDN